MLSETTSDPTSGGLFILVCLSLGVFCRRVLKRTRVPYTVLLLLVGMALGMTTVGDTNMGALGDSTKKWTSIDPHLFLFLFLPALIYEGPGVILSTFLTATLARYVFDYQWSWSQALTFGAMFSATDPVAVVSLLKELGASKRLAILIEGESLFNDGTAMVMFMLFKTLMDESNASTTLPEGLQYFFRLSFGGPLLGLVMGWISVNVLGQIVDDPICEITLTLVTCYSTFYIAEATALGVSGVLAVVILGVYMSYIGKTSVSHVTEHFMHEFWELLGYVANTLIFVVSGAVMVGKYRGDHLRSWDFLLLLVLYIGLHIVRALMIAFLSPILRRIGYGLTLNQAIVISWAGLRGAIGLALALMIEHDHTIPQHTRDVFMFHMAGIVLLTLTINGSTTGLLLSYLKMDRGSFASKKMFETAVQHIEHRTEVSISILKADGFYSDADWSTVWSYIPAFSSTSLQRRGELHPALKEDCSSRSKLNVVQTIEKSFLTQEDEKKTKRHSLRRIPSRSLFSLDQVNIDISGMEDKIASVAELKRRFKIEAYHRFFNLLKSSYWHQFETGFAGKQATRALIESAGKTEDDSTCKKLQCGLDQWKHVAPLCEIPIFMRRLYHVPVIGTLLRQATFQYVSNAFDIATSFIYAHRQVEHDFCELIQGLDLHYKDEALRSISQQVGTEVLSESRHAQNKAQVILDDIHQAFPEIARAVVTRQASYSIIEDIRQFSQSLLSHGEIEEKEYVHVENALVKSRKRLLFHPPKIKLRSEIQVLQDSRPFRRLTPPQIAILHNRAKEHVMNKGQVLFRAGEKSHGFYIITRGNVSMNVESKTSDGCCVEIVIDRVGRGGIVGILGFLTNSVRHSTVKCDSYVQAYYIDQSVFQYLTELPDVGKDVEECLWQQAGTVVAMKYLDRFKSLTPTTIRQICSQAYLIKPPKKTELRIREEFILLRGVFTKCDGKKVSIGAFAVLHRPKSTLLFEKDAVLLVIPPTSRKLMGRGHTQMLQAIKRSSAIRQSRRDLKKDDEFGRAISAQSISNFEFEPTRSNLSRSNSTSSTATTDKQMLDDAVTKLYYSVACTSDN